MEADLSQNIMQERSLFPKKMILWTIFAIALAAVMHWQSFWITDTLNWPPAVAWITTVVLGLLTILLWGFWLLFFGKQRVAGLLFILVPAVFSLLFYPNFKGSADFDGFKARFWSRSADFVETKGEGDGEGNDAVDLKTTGALDFPQLLGPNRDGTLQTVELADSWKRVPAELWKIDIGDGWSGFAAVNGFAVTQEQRGDQECVTCYEIKTGELKWINSQTRRHEDTMAMGKAGPRATPTIHEGRVYVTSATGVLDCLDGSNGKLIWSKNVPEMVGITQLVKKSGLGLDYTVEDSRLAWGRSASPLIVGDLVITPAGGPASIKPEEPEPMTTMIAFDKNSGEEKWRGGDKMIAYGSPRIVSIAGTNQIVLATETDVVAHDVETGEELWSHPWYGISDGAANCSQITVVDDGLLIISKGYTQGSELISVSQDAEGKWASETIQKDRRLIKTKLTSPVIYQGHAYSLSDGFLECVEAKTFERKWKQRGRFGHGQILLVGDKLLVHSESGTLFLVSPDPSEYQELGKVKTIKGICWNTICLYGDLLLLRSEVEAACYQLPLANPMTVADSSESDSTDSVSLDSDQSEIGTTQ